MNKHKLEDLAYEKAVAFKPWAEAQLAEAESGNVEIPHNLLVQIHIGLSMSIDELKKGFLKKFQLKGSTEISNEEFAKSERFMGTVTANAEALHLIFEEREAKYLEYYRIDKTDPGLMYIVYQIIQDEMQVARLRQSLVEAEFKPKQTADEKDDLSKKLIDSINKINKSVFEFTKFLKMEREETERKVLEEKTQKEREDKLGLSIQDFQLNRPENPQIQKAQETQSRKAEEYLKENISGNE